MFNRLDDFRSSWKEETQDTLKVLAAISDQALDQSVAPGYRDLRRLAWHLVESIGLARQIGLAVEGPACNGRGNLTGPLPHGAEAVVAAYTRSAESLLKALEAWNDGDLQKVDVMFGHLHWTKGQTLFAIIAHQIHHRGQMTVLMRQAGIPVPEFYGPTREGWAALGMPAPAV
jgi:uncharacterized damage-inducible protein DinB